MSDNSVKIRIEGDASDFEKKLNELEEKAKKAANSIDQVTKSSEKASSAINDTKGMDELRDKAEEASKSVEQIAKNAEKVSGAFGDAKSINKMGDSIEDTEKKTDELKESLKDAGEAAEEAGDKGEKAAGRSKMGLADLKAGIDMVSAAVEKIASVAKKGVDYNAAMESYRTSFEVMTGSAEKAAEVVERLRTMGAETPFETKDLVQTTQLLMQYGFTADDAISKMTRLGDIAQGNREAMNSIALGYAQMSSAGKVNLQDIKQMINGGFNPLQEISKRTGESMASLYDRISKGTMSIDEITQAMVHATSEGGKFYQSMEKQSRTLSGQLATLQDNANELLGSMTSGLSESLSNKVLPMVNNIIGELQGAFDKNGFQGLLDSATGMIPDLIGMMTGKLDDAMDGLLRWAPKLADALTESLPSVVNGLSSMIPTLTMALFEVASNIVSGLITMLPELVPALAVGIFNTVSAAFTGLDSLVGGLFDGIHKALVKIGADIPYVGESVQKMLDSVSQEEIDDIVKNADVDFDISVSADDVIAEVNTAKTTIEEKLAEIDGIDASKIVATTMLDSARGGLSTLNSIVSDRVNDFIGNGTMIADGADGPAEVS